MGQLIFYPPNVRGWVGGRQWINSATLTARRQFVESLFNPIDENSLNADEQLELAAARSNGPIRFTVSDDLLRPIAQLDIQAAADRLADDLLSVSVTTGQRTQIGQFLSDGGGDEQQRMRRLRRAVVTLMQSPEYQLC